MPNVRSGAVRDLLSDEKDVCESVRAFAGFEQFDFAGVFALSSMGSLEFADCKDGIVSRETSCFAAFDSDRNPLDTMGIPTTNWNRHRSLWTPVSDSNLDAETTCRLRLTVGFAFLP